ncbi:TPA: hypothetical protein NV922_001314 [Escherichia coli]|nr:hypothetical protein [Escherichia coli]
MKSLTVMVQYVGHVVNAQGSVTYRKVDIELTPEQQQKLVLSPDEYYGPVSINDDQKAA